MPAEEILRDPNRASISIWRGGNESPVSDARNAFLTTLAKDAHALDDSRLVSAALLVGRKEEGGTSVFTVDDPLIPALDVMAVNAYNGWYTPDKLSDLASRSEEHTSELQSLMRISYAVFCFKKKNLNLKK